MPSLSLSGSGQPSCVLEAVLVLGIVRALVALVGDAVLVVVRVGAAVLVLEAVAVLGLVGALVVRVEDAVAVAIAVAGRRRGSSDGRRRRLGLGLRADRGLEDEAEEDALVGGLEAGRVARAAAEQKYEFPSMKSLMPPTASALGRCFAARGPADEVGPVRLGDEVERVEDAHADARRRR